MAAQSPSPFTNTRLMLAGVICGAVAALMGYLHIREIEKSKVGEKVTVYYVRKERVNTNEPLEATHLGKGEVSKEFFENAPKLVRSEKLNIFLGRAPVRTLYQGEPLLATAFEAGTSAVNLPDVPLGCKQRTVAVNSRRTPGQGLNVGDIVSLTANFRLGEKSTDKAEVRPLRLLERVQVRLIDGRANPNAQDKKTIHSITIFVGDETAEWLTFLESTRMENEFTIEGEPPGARVSEPNKEIPNDVKELLQTRFPGVVTTSSR
ncbi:MAG: hypothetical protein JXL80_14365 [Planctomycetes bacterium]|nr:hypothetical protein [Planctomycetota bacterium]